MATLNFLEHFKAARRVSTPIIAVRTPDPGATIGTIATDKVHAAVPIMLWDVVRGLIGVNGAPPPDKSHQPPQLGCALAQMMIAREDKEDKDPRSLCDPVAMLRRALEMPKESILFMSNLNRFMHEPQVVQAVWNIRDAFKQNTRTLIIICPDITLPPLLSQSVLVLDEPLPTAEELAIIVGETYAAANVKMPDAPKVGLCVDALCGMDHFSAEQQCAMSIRKDGMDVEQLTERKCKTIEQTGGLTVWRGKQLFRDIGGCDNSKKFFSLIMNGKNRPRGIVFQDEIEKQFAGGSGGDLSGVTQELLGNQLSFMQDHESTGIMLIGHPGVAKSDMAKAFGNEANIPTIQLNLGNAKGSLVGESNANMRTILKVIEAVTQGRALWIATSNDIRALPPELRSRYTFGTFFFDLPTPAERAIIWNIYFEKFALEDRDKPLDSGWNGREIKNCCRLASDLNIPLREAAKYINPMSVSAKERIVELRKEADGRYISAAYEGVYKSPSDSEVEAEPTGDMVVAVGIIPGNKRKIDPGGSGTPPTKKGSVN